MNNVKHEIPEDLREDYRAVTNYESIPYRRMAEIIERIAQLTADLEKANSVTIQFGGDVIGWCSSCDLVCETGTIDAQDRYCCGVCGDYLIFNEKALLDELKTMRSERDAALREVERLRDRERVLAEAVTYYCPVEQINRIMARSLANRAKPPEEDFTEAVQP